MILLDLPNDVLFNIFDILPIGDFVSIVRTCKHIHIRAKSQIDVHQSYLRRYSSLQVKDPIKETYPNQFSWSLNSPLDLFGAVKTDPLIAEYVSHLRFDYPRYIDEADLPRDDIELSLTERQIENRDIRRKELRLLEQSPLLGKVRKAILRRHFTLLVAKDFSAHEMTLSLAVSLFPFLHRLEVWSAPKINMDWSYFSFCRPTTFRAVRLEILELVDCDGLDHLMPFFQLPNLRELIVCRTDVYFQHQSCPKSEAAMATSKLCVMRFHDCSIFYSSLILVDLLRMFPTCHTLEVSYDLGRPSFGVGPYRRGRTSAAEVERVFASFEAKCDEYLSERQVHIEIDRDGLWEQMICNISKTSEHEKLH